MADLVHADQPRCELEHVIAKRDDDELGVLRPLLDVIGDNRDLRELLVSKAWLSREMKSRNLRF